MYHVHYRFIFLHRKSASCTHDIVLLSESEIHMFKRPVTTANEEVVLPVTSYACKKNVSKKHKASTLHMSGYILKACLWKGEVITKAT